MDKFMDKLKKYSVITIIAVAAYASLIAFPLQYLQLPGYRAIGEPLSGGWRWGGAFGCFDDVPVLYFEGSDGFLVREGEIFWKLFENVKLKKSRGSLELTGRIYPFDVRSLNPIAESVSGKPHSFAIKYSDNGKILIAREMHVDGVAVRDRRQLKPYILAQCGYPGLTLFLLRTFGIKEYWRQPIE